MKPDPDPSEKKTLRFGKNRRVRKGFEFQSVYNSKLYAADGILVVNGYYRLNEADKKVPLHSTADNLSRIGLAVSKKAGNSPQRNKWKRQIRNSFRINQHRFPDGWDFVVRPKKGAQFDGPAIQKSLPKLILKVVQKSKIQASKKKKLEKQRLQEKGPADE